MYIVNGRDQGKMRINNDLWSSDWLVIVLIVYTLIDTSPRYIAPLAFNMAYISYFD